MPPSTLHPEVLPLPPRIQGFLIGRLFLQWSCCGWELQTLGAPWKEQNLVARRWSKADPFWCFTIFHLQFPTRLSTYVKMMAFFVNIGHSYLLVVFHGHWPTFWHLLKAHLQVFGMVHQLWVEAFCICYIDDYRISNIQTLVYTYIYIYIHIHIHKNTQYIYCIHVCKTNRNILFCYVPYDVFNTSPLLRRGGAPSCHAALQ